MNKSRFYKGYRIERSNLSGMYITDSCIVGYLRADTLSGIKEMVDWELLKLSKLN
jgi:hypothetical protein